MLRLLLIVAASCVLSGCAVSLSTSVVEVETPDGSTAHPLEVKWEIRKRTITMKGIDDGVESIHNRKDFEIKNNAVFLNEDGFKWTWR